MSLHIVCDDAEAFVVLHFVGGWSPFEHYTMALTTTIAL